VTLEIKISKAFEFAFSSIISIKGNGWVKTLLTYDITKEIIRYKRDILSNIAEI
jgi:hypothetical protein